MLGQAGSRSVRCRSWQRWQDDRPGSTSGPTTPVVSRTRATRCGTPARSSRSVSRGSPPEPVASTARSGPVRPGGRLARTEGATRRAARTAASCRRAPTSCGAAAAGATSASWVMPASSTTTTPTPAEASSDDHRGADPAGAGDLDHAPDAGERALPTPPSLPGRSEAGGDVGREAVTLGPAAARRSARWSAAASSSTPARLSTREQLVEPRGVHAEPGRPDREAAQVPGAVEAVEDPGGTGVEPADDHGVRRVDAELEGAAVPPDAAERGLELRALGRHAEERDTVRPTRGPRRPQAGARPRLGAARCSRHHAGPTAPNGARQRSVHRCRAPLITRA